MSLNEGGMQYLIAGARANVGLKGGRYMFEAGRSPGSLLAMEMNGGKPCWIILKKAGCFRKYQAKKYQKWPLFVIW